LFSLSRAQVDDYTNPSDYEDGADGAREKAIGYYETLLQHAPTSEEATYAQWALPRLKLSVATQQRRFRCFYD
jgi:hypothetical protein